MTQMNAYLLRHGEASSLAPDGSLADDARELTEAGTARLRTACSVYSRVIGPARRILHSPLARARQSAEILAASCAVEVTLTEIADLRPGGRASNLIDLLQGELLDGCESLVLVGHEPLLGDLLGLLTTGNDRLSIPVGKGMLAGVRMSGPQVMVGRLRVLLSQEEALRLAGQG